MREPWDPDDFSIPMDQEELLGEAMDEAGLPAILKETMLKELQETKAGVHDIIFVSTNGERAIKAIHVPESALNGKSGPVIFPSADPLVLIAAFSKEFISRKVDEIDELDAGLRDEAWENMIAWMAESIELEYTVNPPTWEEM